MRSIAPGRLTWRNGSEHLRVGVAQARELGLMQALGLQDALTDEGEVVHNVPPQRQPRSLLPRHASPEGMNVSKT